MKLRIDQVAADAARGLRPVYLISGDEALMVGEALDTLRKAAKEQDFSTRELLIAERGFDWSELTVSGQSLSLFSEKKIIDLRLPTGKPGKPGSDAICEYLASPPEDTILLISAAKLDGSAMSSRWVKAIDKAGAVIRVWPLEARELPGWIQGRLRSAGLTASRDAVLHLARRVEGNLLAAQQEIDKLALMHDGSEISPETIDDAVADSARYSVFLLADEAMSGRVNRALRMLGGLRREGVVPVLVLWALGREARMLAAMAEQLSVGRSEAEVMKSHRIWNQRQGIVRQALARIDRQSGYALVSLAERADRAAKGQSGENPWQLLTQMIVLLAGGRSNGQAA